MRDSWLVHAIAGSRASDARGHASLCSQRHRLPLPHPRCRRFSPRWSAMQAPHRPEPRPHRHQTGGIAPLEARHAGDTPWRDFSCCKTPTVTRTESDCGTHERKGQAAMPCHPIMGQLHTGPRCSIHRNEAHATTYNTDFPKPALRKVTSPATQSVR